jgi:hypothetical protein
MVLCLFQVVVRYCPTCRADVTYKRPTTKSVTPIVADVIIRMSHMTCRSVLKEAETANRTYAEVLMDKGFLRNPRIEAAPDLRPHELEEVQKITQLYDDVRRYVFCDRLPEHLRVVLVCSRLQRCKSELVNNNTLLVVRVCKDFGYTRKVNYLFAELRKVFKQLKRVVLPPYVGQLLDAVLDALRKGGRSGADVNVEEVVKKVKTESGEKIKTLYRLANQMVFRDALPGRIHVQYKRSLHGKYYLKKTSSGHNILTLEVPTLCPHHIRTDILLLCMKEYLKHKLLKYPQDENEIRALRHRTTYFFDRYPTALVNV